MTILSTAVDGAFRRLAKAADSPISQEALKLFEKQDWGQLVKLKVDPMDYESAEQYHKDVVCVSFLRKCRDLPTGIDKAKAAVDNFWEGERQCYETNERLSPLLFGVGDEHVLDIVSKTRKLVASVLGRAPAVLDGRFGPGSTFSDRGKLVTIPDKMTENTSFTPATWPWLLPWSGTAWASALASAGRQPNSVPGNRFTTVPKDAEKDRGICIEPSINLFYQLAVGGVIRRKLKGVGIDLVNGQDLHRRVAYLSSVHRHCATIDLSNASDTVCRNLVRLLLPPDWFDLLESLRSPKTLIEGKWVVLEKYSSMGNGYTFELETLLFLALSAATCMARTGVVPQPGKHITVFGDDIIVPTDDAVNVLAVLKYFGFSANSTKTFIEGPFRESCGGDFHNGKAVRPYYLDKLPNEPEEYIGLANGLRALAADDPQGSWHGHFAFSAWLCVLDAIPSDIRCCRGPKALGNLVLQDDSSRWVTRTRSSIRYLRVYRRITPKRLSWANWRGEVVLAAALYGCSDGSSNRLDVDPKTGLLKRDCLDAGGIIPRGAVSGHKLGWVPFS